MAAAQDVHVRICNQEIVKFDLEVKALIQDIRDCSGPLSALTELNTKVKEKFQQLRHRIQELEQSAKEQDKESEKQVLLQEVENHKKQMLSNQTSWRKANLTCKIAIDNLEKAELLQGGDLFRQRKTAKESLAQTSSAITESLMGISRMMSQQVQQSEEAMQTLAHYGYDVCNLLQNCSGAGIVWGQDYRGVDGSWLILHGLSWMQMKSSNPCQGPSSWDGSSSQNIIAES
uniref:BCL2 interacting protein 1 n=1 Tax=Ovis aries TaxID=9940 RepID=A0AC11DLT3_SHEEP